VSNPPRNATPSTWSTSSHEFQCHSQNLSYGCDLDIMASLTVSQTWHSEMAKIFRRSKVHSRVLCRDDCADHVVTTRSWSKAVPVM